MTVFWLIAGLLALVGVVVVLPPLLRGAREPGVRRQRLSRALYEQRLAELDQERAQGSLDEAEYAQARGELDRTLLEELEATEAGEASTGAPPARTPWLAWLIGLGLPVLAAGLYLELTTGLASLSGEPATPRAAQSAPDPQAIRAMIAKLESQLGDNPDDRDGWVRLAQAQGALEHHSEAARAYERADNLAALEHPRLLVDYAEALALADERRVSARASRLLSQALERAPDYPKALWLAGWGAYQREAYQTAAEYWRRLASAAPADDPTLNETIGKLIDEAEQMARQGGTSGDSAAAASESSPAERQGAEAKGPSAPATGGGIDVRVALSPEVAERASPEDTLFVYAQALDGPPMPLALARRRVQDLPLELRLDDSSAMAPGLTLSSAERVRVTARVSESGQATPQSGDLLGRSQALPTGESTMVSITIDEVVP